MNLKRIFFLALLGLVAAPLAQAQMLVERFREGEHYHAVPQQHLWADGKGIEVVEVFNHACIHCFHFQPTLAPWEAKLPADVRFVYLEAPFRPDFALIARGYFAAQKLGIAEKNHQALYDFIWTEKKPVQTLDHIADFYASKGADRAKILALANSPEANAALERAMQSLGRWEVDGTPSVIVAGKYRVVPGEAGSPAEALEVIDYLIAKERAARTPTAS